MYAYRGLGRWSGVVFGIVVIATVVSVVACGIIFEVELKVVVAVAPVIALFRVAAWEMEISISVADARVDLSVLVAT